MSLTKLSDLLPIDPSLSKPNAYQVFGIQAGEQDMRRVKAGMRQTYQRLKETRSSAEPNVWNQALKIAEAARQVLEDPDRKRSLDVALQAAKSKAPSTTSPEQSSTAPSSTPRTAGPSVAKESTPVDPLADLLPKSNPVANRTNTPGDPPPSKPPNQAAAVLGMPPLGAPPPGTPPLGTPPPSPTASPSTPGPSTPGPPASPPSPSTSPVASGFPNSGDSPQINASPQVASGSAAVTWTPPKAKSKKRRRKKNSGMLILGSFVVIMLAAIIYLLTMFSNDERIKVAQTDDGGIVVSQPAPPQTRRDPRVQNSGTRSDGILGGAATSGIADSIRNRNPNNSFNPPGNPAPSDMSPSGMDSKPMAPRDNASTPTGMTPPMTSDSQPPPGMDAMQPSDDPPASSKPSEPSDEEKESMAADIKRIETLLQTADWRQMKPAADQLLKQNFPGEFGERVSTLYDIADLASYYRGGIERGLATLSTGNTFEVVEGLPVIVVEATSQSLAIQFNKRTKEYTLDQLPPRLTEKLASFALQPEKPDVRAALALYRLIHPATNQEYRDDAWKMLESVDGQLPNVDSAKLIAVAKEVLGGDASATN